MSKIGPHRVVIPFRGSNQQRMQRHSDAVEFCITTFGDIQIAVEFDDPPVRWQVASLLTFWFRDHSDAVLFKLSQC